MLVRFLALTAGALTLAASVEAQTISPTTLAAQQRSEIRTIQRAHTGADIRQQQMRAEARKAREGKNLKKVAKPD